MTHPLTADMANTIALLQTQFNQGLDKGWPKNPTLKRDDMAAAICEIAERWSHLGYKWWKHQTPNIAQANMELIDVLHFAVSDAIEVQALDGKDDPVGNVGALLFMASLECDGNKKADAKSMLAMCAQEGRPEYGRPLSFDISALSELLSMLFDAYGDGHNVFVHYVGKNALNHVRQQRGYKEGTYVKQWGSEEDNEVMVRLLMDERERLSGEGALDLAVTILLNHYDTQVAPR